MLNGDSNENGKKNINRSNLQKKTTTTLHEQQTFLFISFPLMLQPDTSWLHVLCLMCSQKILLPLFLFAFFTTTFLIFSPPLKNFYVVLPRKFVSFVCCCCFCSCFLSLALALCRSFSRWASLACRLLSLFLCLSLALYSKFVDMTINLSLIL